MKEAFQGVIIIAFQLSVTGMNNTSHLLYAKFEVLNINYSPIATIFVILMISVVFSGPE